MKKILSLLSLALSMVAMAPAAVVTFTGGTAYWNDHNEQQWDDTTGTVTTIFVPAGSGVTAGNAVYRSVDYYVESGFKFDYVGGTGGAIGNYYGSGNDVIHAHWGRGEMTGIEISKNGGGTFEFNYFVLTSNTLRPGDAPTGFEDVHVQAWRNGTQVGSDVILPPEQFGFPALDVFFGTDFDLVDKIVITSTHTSFSCFGMDSFYIDQAAPVPEPSVAALMVLGAGALLALKRRRGAV